MVQTQSQVSMYSLTIQIDNIPVLNGQTAHQVVLRFGISPPGPVMTADIQASLVNVAVQFKKAYRLSLSVTTLEGAVVPLSTTGSRQPIPKLVRRVPDKTDCWK